MRSNNELFNKAKTIAGGIQRFLFSDEAEDPQSLAKASDVVLDVLVDILVEDVSHSMGFSDYSPSRLDGAKSSLNHFLDERLRVDAECLVGFVEFSARARVVAPPTPIESGIVELKRKIKKLSTKSATNIAAGINFAAREIEKIQTAFEPRILLLTDGESNRGGDPVEAAEIIKAKGIQLDIIGIGGSPEDVNEAELRAMASTVNGELRYWFIESVGELVKKFETLALREIK